jgi:DNA-directed RNA polymerase subunit RPC12/RpoP
MAQSAGIAPKKRGILCSDCGADITCKTRHVHKGHARVDWRMAKWRCHDCWRGTLGREIPERGERNEED